MKRSRALQTAVFACGLVFTAAVSADGHVASGAALGNTCAGCHGTNGQSKGPAPTIAGLSPDYFTSVMNQYKTGEARASIMTRIAKGYDDAEIAAMADHFSKFKYAAADQSADAGAAKRGAKLHDKYCDKCHAEAGMDPGDDAGFLGGQWKPYLNYTLADFMDGKREAPKKMAKNLKKLQKKKGDKGVADLLEFYASQK